MIMFTTKNETSNACPTSAVKATAITIDKQPEQDRHETRHDRPEHEHEDDQRRWQPDQQLALLQVFLGELLEVGVGRQRAGDRNLEAVLSVLRLHKVDHRSDLVASHHEQHHRRVAILRDEGLVIRRVVALRFRDDAEFLPALAETLHLGLERRVVDRVAIRAHDHDLARSRLGREALADELLRLLRLGVARDVALARQRVSEQERDHDERDEHGDEPYGKRPLRMTGAGTRETFGGDGHAQAPSGCALRATATVNALCRPEGWAGPYAPHRGLSVPRP